MTGRRRRGRRRHLRRRDAEVKNRPCDSLLLLVAPLVVVGESPQVDELGVPHQAPRPIVESRRQAAAHAMSLWAPSTSAEPFGSCTLRPSRAPGGRVPERPLPLGSRREGGGALAGRACGVAAHAEGTARAVDVARVVGLGAEEDPVATHYPLAPPHLAVHVEEEVADAHRLPVVVAEHVHAGVGRVGDADEVARPHLRHVLEHLAVPHAGGPVLVGAAGEQVELGLPVWVDHHGELARRRVLGVRPGREEAVHAAGSVVAQRGPREPRVRGVVEALPHHARGVAPNDEVAVVQERGDDGGGGRRRGGGGRVRRPQQGVRRLDEELAAVAQREARG
nr:unnamed protein product [Digitaria exilis]